MRKLLTKEEFIRKAIKIHKNKYNYEYVVYRGVRIKVCIVCPTHGKFWQRANNHLDGKGCKKCYLKKNKKQKKELQELKRKLLNRQIDINIDNYKNNKTKISCKCLFCGYVWKTTTKKLTNHGCPSCANNVMTPEKLKQYKKLLLKKNIRIDIFNYKNARTPINCDCLVCGNRWKSRIRDLKRRGCKACRTSYGESVIRFALEKLLGHTFPNTKHDMYNKKLELDCYSAKLKLAVEVQGIQHFEPVSFSSNITGEAAALQFKKRQENDGIKRKWCSENNIKLIEIDNTDKNLPFLDRIKLVKDKLRENNIIFLDKEITEDEYHKYRRINYANLSA